MACRSLPARPESTLPTSQVLKKAFLRQLHLLQSGQSCLAVRSDVAATMAALPAGDAAVATWCDLAASTAVALSAAAGYKLDEKEVTQLLDSLDLAHTGQVAKSQLAASQIDWREVSLAARALLGLVCPGMPVVRTPWPLPG